MFLCCFGKKREVSVRIQPVLSPPISAEMDFRPPLHVSPASYTIEDDKHGEEEEYMLPPCGSDNTPPLTILDILSPHDNLTKNQKFDLEARVNMVDWKSILDESEKKAKYSPVLYNSELVFNTVKEYDRVFPMKEEHPLYQKSAKMFGLF